MRASDVTAGAVVRQARAHSGLTQREMAARAGLPQSVVAAYERDARDPSLPTLAALVEASGTTLELSFGVLLPSSDRPRGPIGHRLQGRRAAVLALAAKHGVTDLRIFGSVARGDERPDSDLDLLVHLPEEAGLFLLGRFSEALQGLLGVTVDVVPDDGLKARVRNNIEPDLIPL